MENLKETVEAYNKHTGEVGLFYLPDLGEIEIGSLDGMHFPDEVICVKPQKVTVEFVENVIRLLSAGHSMYNAHRQSVQLNK